MRAQIVDVMYADARQFSLQRRDSEDRRRERVQPRAATGHHHEVEIIGLINDVIRKAGGDCVDHAGQ